MLRCSVDYDTDLIVPTYCFQASGGICKFVLRCKNINRIGPGLEDYAFAFF